MCNKSSIPFQQHLKQLATFFDHKLKTFASTYIIYIYIYSDLFDIHWFHNISCLELILKLSLINTIIIIFCLFFIIFSHHFGPFLTSSCINKCLHWCVCNWYIDLMGIHVVLLYPLKQTCLDPWWKLWCISIVQESKYHVTLMWCALFTQVWTRLCNSSKCD